MYKTIKNQKEFDDILNDNIAILVYYSNEACNVCKVLKPKIIKLINSQFPKMEFYYVDIEKTPEISAQQRVFTIPTIIVYFEQKETIRKSRNIGIYELADALLRPYNIIFG